MSGGDYIAIDWGTTNRRIDLMRGDGSVADSVRDDRGVLAMEPSAYPAEISAIRERYGALPVIAAGMVGSTRGWREVPYVDLPATISSLAEGSVEAGDDVRLVPGVASRGENAADVMRGEEVQVLGALARGMAEGATLFCQPGTHNKWIEARGDAITGFSTAMTGELFALLRKHSVLSEMLAGDVSGGAAFREGLERSQTASDLPTALFQARAAALLGARDAADTPSYVSGLLIGADVGAQDIAGREVVLLASGPLADLYAAAIEWAGGRVRRLDSNAAFAAGIHAIWQTIQ